MTDRFPYFRFFPEKFMAGIRGLNANEVKAYICILCRIYESGGPIKRNDDILSTYCEMRPSSFAKALDRLIALEKIKLRNERLTNDAAEAEISWRASKSEKSARAGKISAEKRQENQEQTPTDVQRTPNQEDTEREVRGEAYASHTPSKREPDLFPEFWDAYAHKVAKGDAAKAWKAAIRKADPQSIIAAARLYAATRDPKFVKHPAGWLRDERWTDDPATSQQKETRHGGRNGPGSDPGFEARLARWEELDARCAGAACEPGSGGDDGWGGEKACGVDRAPGFGAVVPLFSAGGR